MWIFLFLPLAAVLIWLLLRDLRGSVAPFVGLPSDVRRKVFEALNVQPGDRFVELGSGYGAGLFQLARERGVFGTGVELDPLPFFISWTRSKCLYGGKVRILYGDLFDLDLGPYNKVYAYLMKRSYPRLKEKFARELQPGSVVVLAGWPLDDTFLGHQIVKEGEERIFVYRY